MAARRPIGGLEDEVMAYVWATMTPATPAEVHQAIAPELAYTTVMTVLTRLWGKGLLNREPRGRGFAYAPVRTEAEHKADQMRSTLAECGDRDAVLSTFVASLGEQEVALLRELLGYDEP